MQRITRLSDLDAYDLVADITVANRDISDENLRRLAEWALHKAERCDELEDQLKAPQWRRILVAAGCL